MATTIVELDALRTEALSDGRIAVARLSALGPVILLMDRADSGQSSIAAGVRGDAGVVVIARIQPDDSRGWQAHSGSGRAVDPALVRQLTGFRADQGADWMIATDGMLASARACPGLRLVCVGPARDGADPIRPDHQAHSLLDAVRHIEAAAAFA